jgi:hypothetical protein
MGLNYEGSDAELSGCINDVNNTKEVLTSVYNYKEEDIVVMTDHTEVKPTARNIVAQLIRLAERSYEEKVHEIWITYSGHGSYMHDTSADETDKQDECLVPLDYEEEGLVPDDVLNHVLGLIHKDVRVVFIVDACHSETMLDLRYNYIAGNKSREENENCKIKTNCIMISGCQDHDYSADAFNINNSKEFSGAMTSALLHSLKEHDYTITCWQLLKMMRRFLKRRKFSQIPQISCTEELRRASLFSTVNPRPFITDVEYVKEPHDSDTTLASYTGADGSEEVPDAVLVADE